MADTVIFTVWPSGRQFKTYLDRNDQKHYAKTYRQAHFSAYMRAAITVQETYVTIGVAAPQRCKLHPSELLDPHSTLRSILRFGLYHAYWDFKTKSWLPLPIHLESEGYIQEKQKLLPPPKRQV